METNRDQDKSTRPVAEAMEGRLLMSASAGPLKAGGGMGGSHRLDSWSLVVGGEEISGKFNGKTLVVHERANTIGGTSRDDVVQIRVTGNNTIGGSLSDRVVLTLSGRPGSTPITVGGAVGLEGIVFEFAGNTIGGTLHPDNYVFHLNTVGGNNKPDLSIRVGANTVGGAFFMDEDDGGGGTPGLG